jgi:hypothetical protein
MCKCIDWLVYSFEESVRRYSPDNKGGVQTRMLNTKMPLKDIINEIRKASEVCEPCKESK